MATLLERLAELANLARSARLLDGPGYQVERGPDGARLILPQPQSQRGGASFTVLYYRITTAATGAGPHTANLWRGNPLDSDQVERTPDETGISVISPGLAASATILTGGYYKGHQHNGTYILNPDTYH